MAATPGHGSIRRNPVKIQLHNQRPAQLDAPLRTAAGPLDPMAQLLTDVVEPLLEPLPGATLVMVDDLGNTLGPDDVMNLAQRCLTGVVDADAEETLRGLLRQALVRFDPSETLRFDDLYPNQAAAALKWPAPGKHANGRDILYTADVDVIPAAKALLAQPTDDTARAGILAALAWTYRPATCGTWFTSQDAWGRFAEWLDAQVQTMSSVLDPDVVLKFDQVRALPMSGLTESLLLRVSETDDNDPTSFARLLVHFLDQYGKLHPEDAGSLPFLLSEHLLPLSLVLVNLDQTARATARALDKEWRIIAQAISSPVKVLNPRAISRLDAFTRAQTTAQQAASALTNRGQQTAKAAPIKLRKTAPTNQQIMVDIKRLLKLFKQVAISHNLVHSPALTFSKANRRDPMNFNLPGKTRRTKYLPDLHVYLDTSGSISEGNYRSSVMMLIGLAKKLDVDLYLSSFSHELSAETLVQTRNRSPKKIWNTIQRIPKVTGGTDFAQIWRHVQASPVRRKRLSVVVTDFGYHAPTQFVKHPKNLVYAPCSNMDWTSIVSYAEGFAKSATHIDSRIARRFLGMALP